ncbi:MAG TPA: membrane protein insertion efficiency factor YidD [Candidatus Acidoferrales bacterium]|nr:membrane protein insertion efficiency factor YidD [Candidatus Acidoferrales bacterium]
MKNICLFAVRAYQVILGPLLGGNCIFYPSCSHYACEAIERHGARHGLWLALRRLLRCHPFSAGGVDLVPEEYERGGWAAFGERPTVRTALTVATKPTLEGRREFAR